jgi:hypothetical protein
MVVLASSSVTWASGSGDAKATDKGLEHRARCKKLTSLVLPKTAVTEPALLKLSAALPQCRIEWDGPTIEPKKGASPPPPEDGEP